MPSIVGLQGSDMFVLSLQVENIFPGEDPELPMVQLRAFFDGEEIGGFFGGPFFLPAPGEENWFVANQLYVVVYQAARMEGMQVRVLVDVDDPVGTQFHGDAIFTAGGRLPGPGIPPH